MTGNTLPPPSPVSPIGLLEVPVSVTEFVKVYAREDAPENLIELGAVAVKLVIVSVELAPAANPKLPPLVFAPRLIAPMVVAAPAETDRAPTVAPLMLIVSPLKAVE